LTRISAKGKSTPELIEESIIKTEGRVCFARGISRTFRIDIKKGLAYPCQARIYSHRFIAKSVYFTQRARSDSHHGEHRVGTVGARVDRRLGRRAGAHDHDFGHRAAATAATGRFEVEPPDGGRQKVTVPSAVSSMLPPRWLRLRCIPRVTPRAIPQTATSGRRLATPRAPLEGDLDYERERGALRTRVDPLKLGESEETTAADAGSLSGFIRVHAWAIFSSIIRLIEKGDV